MANKHGILEVGNDGKEVIINHPDLLVNEKGEGYITFSPAQARNLANLLLKNADEIFQIERGKRAPTAPSRAEKG